MCILALIIWFLTNPALIYRPVLSLKNFSAVKIRIRSPVKKTAMDQHHPEVNEKKILTAAGIVIFIIVVVISYFEWKGRAHY